MHIFLKPNFHSCEDEMRRSWMKTRPQMSPSSHIEASVHRWPLVLRQQRGFELNWIPCPHSHSKHKHTSIGACSEGDTHFVHTIWHVYAPLTFCVHLYDICCYQRTSLVNTFRSLSDYPSVSWTVTLACVREWMFLLLSSGWVCVLKDGLHLLHMVTYGNIGSVSVSCLTEIDNLAFGVISFLNPRGGSEFGHKLLSAFCLCPVLFAF